jgi:hypothetical protein
VKLTSEHQFIFTVQSLIHVFDEEFLGDPEVKFLHAAIETTYSKLTILST